MMNINRSRAVDSFKQHGHLWYHGAQKLPIDIYKDIVLFFEFVERISDLVQTHRHVQEKLDNIIQEWYQAYHDQNFDHPDYGGFVEMLYRRKI
jgi:hypothetical protein